MASGEGESSSYAKRVGECLRAARRHRRMSLVDVQVASDNEFKCSALGAYERGERVISVPRLMRLAQLYEVPVDHLLPRDTPAGEPSGTIEDQDRVDLDRPEVAGVDNAANVAGVDNVATVDAVAGVDNGANVDRVDTFSGAGLAPFELDIVERYVARLRQGRRDDGTPLLHIRQDDVAVMAGLLAMTPDGLRRWLHQLGVLVPA